jgi:hypothetical protein
LGTRRVNTPHGQLKIAMVSAAEMRNQPTSRWYLGETQNRKPLCRLLNLDHPASFS